MTHGVRTVKQHAWKRMFKNWPHYLRIVSDHEAELEDRAVTIINNQGIYREANNLISQLKSVACHLTLCKGTCQQLLLHAKYGWIY